MPFYETLTRPKYIGTRSSLMYYEPREGVMKFNVLPSTLKKLSIKIGERSELPDPFLDISGSGTYSPKVVEHKNYFNMRRNYSRKNLWKSVSMNNHPSPCTYDHFPKPSPPKRWAGHLRRVEPKKTCYITKEDEEYEYHQ